MNKQFLSLLLLVSFGSTVVNASSAKRDAAALAEWNEAVEKGLAADKAAAKQMSPIKKAVSKTQEQMNVTKEVRSQQAAIGSSVGKMNEQYGQFGKSVKNNLEDAKRAFFGYESLAEQAERLAAEKAAEKAAFRYKAVKGSLALSLGVGAGYVTYKYLGNAESKTNKAIIAGTTVATTAGIYCGFDKYVAPVLNSVYNKIAAHPILSLGLATTAALGYGLYKLGSSYAMGNQPQINIDEEIAKSEALLSSVSLLDAQVNNNPTNKVRAQIANHREKTGKDLIEETTKLHGELVKAKNASVK